MFEKMASAFALHAIITDDEGRPVDYRFLDVNPMFEKLTGLKRADIIGKTVLEVLPDTEETWIREFGDVAINGVEKHFEHFSGALNKHYAVSAYCPQPGFFAVTFIDVTARVHADENTRRVMKSLQYQLDFQRLVAEMSFRLSNASVATVDEATAHVLSLMGRFFTVDRCYVMRFSPDNTTVSITYEWCASGIEPQAQNVHMFPLSSVSWWNKETSVANRVLAIDIDDLPPDAKGERDEFGRQGIKTLLNVPIFIGGERVGVLGFDAVRAKRTWTPEQVSLLEVVGSILGTAFERVDHERMRINFTSMAVHELKTPLISLIGASDFLKKVMLTGKNADVAEVAGFIQRGALRMKELIDEMLDFSRIDQGKLVLAIDTASSDAILGDAIDGVARYIASEQRTGGIVVEAPAVPVKVRCDKERVVQVMVNLLSNALKYSPPDANIVIGVADTGPEVKFWVQDTGIGIDPADVRKLFTMFGRLDRDDAPNIQGTGLGLFISKEIVERHGGRIWAESRGKGTGSTFTFTIPKQYQ